MKCLEFALSSLFGGAKFGFVEGDGFDPLGAASLCSHHDSMMSIYLDLMSDLYVYCVVLQMIISGRREGKREVNGPQIETKLKMCVCTVQYTVRRQ